MAANNTPIYSASPDCSTNNGTGMSQLVTAAANDYVGTAAGNTLCFTAGSNGAQVYRLRFKAGGSNVATVARVYVNNGSTNTSAANNAFIGEVQLPATTAIATAGTVEFDYTLNAAINPGFRIYFGLATAVSAGWVCTAFGGQY